ncbi:MAG TPA: lysophospholipid acyltransferase family protein [Candidatus Micrarchaeaceae archaeon]|nr:lysophospholipid acyltransferase family protein [Candidatus Micrarchaeaceae archaeon]
MSASRFPAGATDPEPGRHPRVGPGTAPGVRLDGRQSPLLIVTRAVLRITVRLSARGGVQLEGLSNVPPAGPLLICSNHVSNFDPLVYAAILPRVLHALTKAELYRNPIMRAFFTRCNCIPVRRGEPDRRAIRGALAVLRSGGALLLFPEGHRASAGGMLPFEAGAGYLALRSEANILPCAIWGTEAVLPKGRLVPRRGTIAVRLGPSFRPTSGDPVLISQEISAEIARLLPERYRPSADRV